MKINDKKLSEIRYGRLLFVVDFILPVPLTFFSIWLWYYKSANLEFSIFVTLFALLFGYIIPGIGTNFFKLWRFKWNIFKVGNYFWHHGFMYAPYYSIALWLTFGDFKPMTGIHLSSILISNTFLLCFLTSIHDYFGLESGMIEIKNRPFRQGKSNAEIFMNYGPIGYAIFGFTYTMSCLIAYYWLDGSILRFILLLVLGLSLMGLSGLDYVYRELKTRKEDAK